MALADVSTFWRSIHSMQPRVRSNIALVWTLEFTFNGHPFRLAASHVACFPNACPTVRFTAASFWVRKVNRFASRLRWECRAVKTRPHRNKFQGHHGHHVNKRQFQKPWASHAAANRMIANERPPRLHDYSGHFFSPLWSSPCLANISWAGSKGGGESFVSL